MPSLPRIRRTRARDGAVVAAAPPAPAAELTAAGLTWIHLDAPTPLQASDLAHASGGIRSTSKTSCRVASGRRSTSTRRRLPVRGPPLPRLRQDDPAAERRRARPLRRRELPRHAADGRVAAGDAPLPPLRGGRAFRDQLFSKGSGRLLYELLDDLFDYCFPILDKIGYKLDSLEDDVFEGRSEEVVRDISNVKQEIISYRKIIKPERGTLRVLERRIERFLPEELELYFDDIVDAAERIWDILDNYKEVIEALEDTNESVISHRQNDVLRFLTVFSVVLLPLTLITGFFGMNVNFPASARPGRSGRSPA
jgi:Mg2+ and Co2+ transporters